MISAVYKKTTNLKLHYFSNFPAIDNERVMETRGVQVTNELEASEFYEKCKGRASQLLYIYLLCVGGLIEVSYFKYSLTSK